MDDLKPAVVVDDLQEVDEGIAGFAAEVLLEELSLGFGGNGATGQERIEIRFLLAGYLNQFHQFVSQPSQLRCLQIEEALQHRRGQRVLR